MSEPDYKAMYEDAEQRRREAEDAIADLESEVRELENADSGVEQIVEDLKNQLHRIDVLGLDSELTVSDVLRDAVERLERL